MSNNLEALLKNNPQQQMYGLKLEKPPVKEEDLNPQESREERIKRLTQNNAFIQEHSSISNKKWKEKFYFDIGKVVLRSLEQKIQAQFKKAIQYTLPTKNKNYPKDPIQDDHLTILEALHNAATKYIEAKKYIHQNAFYVHFNTLPPLLQKETSTEEESKTVQLLIRKCVIRSENESYYNESIPYMLPIDDTNYPQNWIEGKHIEVLKAFHDKTILYLAFKKIEKEFDSLEKDFIGPWMNMQASRQKVLNTSIKTANAVGRFLVVTVLLYLRSDKLIAVTSAFASSACFLLSSKIGCIANEATNIDLLMPSIREIITLKKVIQSEKLHSSKSLTNWINSHISNIYKTIKSSILKKFDIIDIRSLFKFDAYKDVHFFWALQEMIAKALDASHSFPPNLKIEEQDQKRIKQFCQTLEKVCQKAMLVLSIVGAISCWWGYNMYLQKAYLRTAREVVCALGSIWMGRQLHRWKKTFQQVVK